MAEEAAGRRVLVVSDDNEAGRFLGRVLEDSGFETLSSTVSDMAIELASSYPPIDAVMGDSIGETDVRRVRNLADASRAATPIVVLAAYHSGRADEEAVIAAGATAWVTRPVIEHDLVKAVREALATDPEDTASG